MPHRSDRGRSTQTHRCYDLILAGEVIGYTDEAGEILPLIQIDYREARSA